MLRAVRVFGRTLAVAMVLAIVACAPSSGAASGGWRIENTPAVPSRAELAAVTATSAGDAWAVGCSGAEYQGCLGGRALIEHSDGGAWTTMPFPAPATESALFGVRATSSSNAWAVGTRDGRTLIAHWDGGRWRRQASPSLDLAKLRGIAALSDADAWAVGSGYDGGDLVPIALHFDGKTWTTNQPAVSAPAVFEGVTMAASNDVWAVGLDARHGKPLIEHYDGTGWHRTQHGGSWELTAVSAASPTDVWAVGVEDTEVELIIHYDGTGWKRVGPRVRGTALHGVTALSATDLWAVGLRHPHGFRSRTMILHYDGHSWQSVHAPNAGPRSAGLLGIASASSKLVAVGFQWGAHKSLAPLAMRCCS